MTLCIIHLACRVSLPPHLTDFCDKPDNPTSRPLHWAPVEACIQGESRQSLTLKLFRFPMCKWVQHYECHRLKDCLKVCAVIPAPTVIASCPTFCLPSTTAGFFTPPSSINASTFRRRGSFQAHRHPYVIQVMVLADKGSHLPGLNSTLSFDILLIKLQWKQWDDAG